MKILDKFDHTELLYNNGADKYYLKFTQRENVAIIRDTRVNGRKNNIVRMRTKEFLIYIKDKLLDTNIALEESKLKMMEQMYKRLEYLTKSDVRKLIEHDMVKQSELIELMVKENQKKP